MASSSYITESEPFWDPYRLPLSVPQETASRSFVQVLPQANALNTNFNALSQIQFQIPNSEEQIDWYNTYIAASFQILTTGNAAYTATQNVTLVREPQFFINAKMSLAGAPIEQGTPYQTTACWLQKLMLGSHAAKQAQGVSDLSYDDPVMVPTDEAVWPPTPSGVQSVDLHPLIANGGTPTYLTAVGNPAYNLGNVKRQAKTAVGRVASFRIPLASIYSFINKDTPTWWGGGTTSLTLQPAPAAEVIFNSVDTAAFLSCTNLVLWLATRKARSDVMGRILKEAALGKSNKYQWLACEVPQQLMIPANATSFTQPITLSSASPQYMALIFKPATYTTQATHNQLAYPPVAIGGTTIGQGNCPYKNAFVSYLGQQPAYGYGVNGAADLARLYRAFCEMCDQLAPEGAGCYVDYDQFITQKFVTVFDLRGRDPNAAPVSTPSNQATINLQFNGTTTGGVAMNVWVITFGVKECEVKYAVNGVAITQY